MKVKWFGHSCFLLTSATGSRVLMDPFKAEKYLTYPPVRAKVDIVTVSHEHFDHNYLAGITGNPEVLRGSLDKEAGGIYIKGINAFHDNTKGGERGLNTIFCVNMDGINICHLGDLGHVLDASGVSSLGKVDVLLVPVGGIFTIGIDEAAEIVGAVKPRIAIPMHYKTAMCQFLQWSSADFTKGKKGVREAGSDEIEVNAADMPAAPGIAVLQYPG